MNNLIGMKWLISNLKKLFETQSPSLETQPLKTQPPNKDEEDEVKPEMGSEGVAWGPGGNSWLLRKLKEVDPPQEEIEADGP